jgi:hypothetical protein
MELDARQGQYYVQFLRMLKRESVADEAGNVNRLKVGLKSIIVFKTADAL